MVVDRESNPNCFDKNDVSDVSDVSGVSDVNKLPNLFDKPVVSCSSKLLWTRKTYLFALVRHC